MPEFEQQDLSPIKSVIVHFGNQQDIDAFSKLVEQTITNKAKFIWYPKKEHMNLLAMVAHDESEEGPDYDLEPGNLDQYNSLS